MIPITTKQFLRGLEIAFEIEGARKSEILNKNIEPMFEDFKVVHHSYMDNLRTIRRLVQSGNKLSEIILQIHEERLFSEARRSEIKAFLRTQLGRAQTTMTDEEGLEFCYGLRDYLSDPKLGIYENLHGQRWYTNLSMMFEFLSELQPKELSSHHYRSVNSDGSIQQYQELQRIVAEAGNDKQIAALRVIDLMVEEMQVCYARICDAYARLKDKEIVNTIADIETRGVTITSILFISADPSDASRLRLGEELREIHEKLQLAKLRDRFVLEKRMSVRPADISQALLDVQPQIVHFSGHGLDTGAVCFENLVGETHPIDPEALGALFEQFSDVTKCVVLNACYSEFQASAIAAHVDHVVGMSRAIGDKAAIAFSIGFYQALGAGRTVPQAYKLGCVQIRLQGGYEYDIPVLIEKRTQIEADTIQPMNPVDS